jgi:hypothetical protein
MEMRVRGVPATLKPPIGLRDGVRRCVRKGYVRFRKKRD